MVNTKAVDVLDGNNADLLAPIADPERLAEVGDWLVRCDTAAEFLARFYPAAPS